MVAVRVTRHPALRARLSQLPEVSPPVTLLVLLTRLCGLTLLAPISLLLTRELRVHGTNAVMPV